MVACYQWYVYVNDSITMIIFYSRTDFGGHFEQNPQKSDQSFVVSSNSFLVLVLLVFCRCVVMLSCIYSPCVSLVVCRLVFGFLKHKKLDMLNDFKTYWKTFQERYYNKLFLAGKTFYKMWYQKYTVYIHSIIYK